MECWSNGKKISGLIRFVIIVCTIYLKLFCLIMFAMQKIISPY